MKWKIHAIVGDKEPVYINGYNLWEYENDWKNLSGTYPTEAVTDPLYNKRYMAYKYYLKIGSTEIIFSTEEFTNGIYGFFVPDN